MGTKVKVVRQKVREHYDLDDRQGIASRLQTALYWVKDQEI